MVFHLFERLLGVSSDPKHFLHSQTSQHYIEAGFSQEEAQQLAWLSNHSHKGTYLGTAAGLTFLYFVNPFYNQFAKTIPYLKYQPNVGILLKVSTVALFAFFGNYLANSKRQAGNFWVTNFFSNNTFSRSQEAFIRNFTVMNRQFTEQEIQQFNENIVRERPEQRKWIYNPNIHGPSEEEFHKHIDLYFKKNLHPTERADVKETIKQQNSDKIQNGETIQLKPYSIVNDVDKTGLKHGVVQSPINKHGVWYAIQ